jgi:hypothetical protein
LNAPRTLNGYIVNGSDKWRQTKSFVIIVTIRHFTCVCCHLAQTFPSTSSPRSRLLLQQFHFYFNLYTAMSKLFLNTQLIADLNSRGRNYDCIGWGNYVWLFACEYCRCDNYINKMSFLSSELIWTLMKLCHLILHVATKCCGWLILLLCIREVSRSYISQETGCHGRFFIIYLISSKKMPK